MMRLKCEECTVWVQMSVFWLKKKEKKEIKNKDSTFIPEPWTFHKEVR